MSATQSLPKCAGTILVVGDEPSASDPPGMLKVLFFHIFTASSNQEAFAAVDTEEIDLLLVEAKIPENCGFDLVRQEWPEVQCLVMSALSDQQPVITAMRGGAVNFLKRTGGGRRTEDCGVSGHV